MIRGTGDWLGRRAGHNAAQKMRSESVGVLIASGLIAGEALTGLLFATFRFRDIKIPEIFADPSYLLGFAVLVILGFVMVRLPLANAGNPDDPAPPAVMM
jgi:peptidoglycan/LPS O-acetylase OafA/YrhL